MGTNKHVLGKTWYDIDDIQYTPIGRSTLKQARGATSFTEEADNNLYSSQSGDTQTTTVLVLTH